MNQLLRNIEKRLSNLESEHIHDSFTICLVFRDGRTVTINTKIPMKYWKDKQ